jgi:hypothetical protein
MVGVVGCHGLHCRILHNTTDSTLAGVEGCHDLHRHMSHVATSFTVVDVGVCHALHSCRDHVVVSSIAEDVVALHGQGCSVFMFSLIGAVTTLNNHGQRIATGSGVESVVSPPVKGVLFVKIFMFDVLTSSPKYRYVGAGLHFVILHLAIMSSVYIFPCLGAKALLGA